VIRYRSLKFRISLNPQPGMDQATDCPPREQIQLQNWYWTQVGN